MAIRASVCSYLAPESRFSRPAVSKQVFGHNRIPRSNQGSMSTCSAVAVKKGQEQFIDDKSKYEALKGVKVLCICKSASPDQLH